MTLWELVAVVLMITCYTTNIVCAGDIYVGEGRFEGYLVDSNWTSGVIIDPDYYIPEDGVIKAFKVQLFTHYSPNSVFRFIVWKQLASYSNYTSKTVSGDFKVQNKTKWLKPRDYGRLFGSIAGPGHINLNVSEYMNVTKGSVLSVQCKYGACPIPYSVNSYPSFLSKFTYSNFLNFTVMDYNVGSTYTFNVSNTSEIFQYRKYSYQALLSTQEPEEDCLVIFASSYGLIDSRAYDNSSCFVIVNQPRYHYSPVQIDFITIDLTCDEGYILVYDGNGTEGMLVKNITRRCYQYVTPNPGILVSNGSQPLTVKLVSANVSDHFILEYKNYDIRSTTRWSPPYWTTTSAPVWCLRLQARSERSMYDDTDSRPGYYGTEAPTYNGNGYYGQMNYLTSANYPYNYYSATEDCYIIEPLSPDERVVIHFLDFEVEKSNGCLNDYLQIIKGSEPYDPVWHTFCGYSEYDPNFPKEYKYVSDVPGPLRLTFKSNYHHTYRGFNLTYYTVPQEIVCEKVRVYDMDDIYNDYTLTYPKYGTYNASEDKCWILSADYDKTLMIEVAYIDIEESYGCSADYLKIRDGYSNSSTVLETLCGDDRSRTTVYSTSSDVHITFHSDGYIEGSGFKLSIAVMPRYPGTEYPTLPSGVPSFAPSECEYLTAYNYHDTIYFSQWRVYEDDQALDQGINKCWIIHNYRSNYLMINTDSIYIDGETCGSSYMHIIDGRETYDSVLRTYCPGKQYSYDTIKAYQDVRIELVLQTGEGDTSIFLTYYRSDGDDHEDDDLEGWAIALICIGVLLFIVIIIVVPVTVVCCYKRRKTTCHGATRFVNEPEPVQQRNIQSAPQNQPLSMSMQVTTSPMGYNAPLYAVYNTANGAVLIPQNMTGGMVQGQHPSSGAQNNITPAPQPPAAGNEGLAAPVQQPGTVNNGQANMAYIHENENNNSKA